MNNSPQSSEHHRIPTSRGGSDHYVNKGKIPHKRHEAHHLLYENSLPHEIIAQLICENRDVLSEKFVRAIRRVLDSDVEDIYQIQAFKSGKAIDAVRDEQKSCLRKLLQEGRANGENEIPIFKIHFPSDDFDPPHAA